VNDTGPHQFVLDSGAGACLLSAALARKLNLQPGETKEAQTAGGRVSVALCNVDSIAIGAARVDSLPVAIMDLTDLDQAVGSRIDGDIGYNFLKEFRVTIDYGANTLSLARGQQETIGTAVLQEIEFTLAGPTRPLVLVRTMVNGKGPYNFALDSGNSTTLISPQLARGLGLKQTAIPALTTGGGHKAQATISSLESLSVGGRLVQNLTIVIADVFTALNQVAGAEFEGIIGYNFLKAFRVTINYPERVLQLGSPQQKPAR
jgi:predicted aspartyl protease